jgi:hypothetical protein
MEELSGVTALSIRCQRFKVQPHGFPFAERFDRSHAHGQARFSASERHAKAFDGKGAVAKLRVSKGVREVLGDRAGLGLCPCEPVPLDPAER